MIVSLDRIPDYQNWLPLNRLENTSNFSSNYYAITLNTNKTEYPVKHKFLNSDRYLESIILQDQDCLSFKQYTVSCIYCLQYIQSSGNIDCLVFDKQGNHTASHKLAKLVTKNNEIKIKYSDLIDSEIFLGGFNNKVIRKQILEMIDDLEIVITGYKLDNSKIDDTFLTDRDRNKRSHCKTKKRYVPVKRSRSYQVNYK
jgi:hypothetical protein